MKSAKSAFHPRTKDWMLLPSLCGIGLFYLIPLVQSIFYAFSDGLYAARFVGGYNFRTLCEDPLFQRAVTNTLLFFLVGISALLAVSLYISLICVNGKFVWQPWALLLPIVVPVPCFASGWQLMWGNGGLVHRLLAFLPCKTVDFMQGVPAFWLMLLLYIIKNAGYISILLSGAIRVLPTEIQDSYRLDGNSEWVYVTRILLPQLRSTLFFCVITAIMNYFLLFRDMYALYGSAPPDTLYMLQHYMNRNFYRLNFPKLSAAALLTCLVIGAILAVGFCLSRRKYDVQ